MLTKNSKYGIIKKPIEMTRHFNRERRIYMFYILLYNLY